MTSSSEFGSAVRAAKTGRDNAAAQIATEKSLRGVMRQHQRLLPGAYFLMSVVYSMKTEVNYETGAGGYRDPGVGAECICGYSVRISTNDAFRPRIDPFHRYDGPRSDRRRPVARGVRHRQRFFPR